MAWNEPGKDDDHRKPADKDPWKRNREEGPPDLDAALRRFFKKLAQFLGGKQRVSSAGGPTGAQRPSFVGSMNTGMILVIALVLYGLSGIYIVDPAEEAVITRFGKYVRTEAPGPHWYPLGIEQKEIVNVKEVLTNQHAGLMLTKDENIVNVEIAVHYFKENPQHYLFNIFEPEETLKQVTDSALRYVIGHSTLDNVLTSGRSEIAARIKEQVVRNLADYASGIQVTDVVMQPAKAPDQVKSAFDDAIRAQEDEVRLLNQADSYARRIQPIAEGKAQRLLQEAEAYKQEVIALAKGDVQKFTALLPQYQKAPRVTRDRLYIDALERIFMNTTKVLLDVGDGNNVLYLPIDKWINAKSAPSAYAPSSVLEQPTAMEEPAANTNPTVMEEAPLRVNSALRSNGRERPTRVWSGE